MINCAVKNRKMWSQKYVATGITCLLKLKYEHSSKRIKMCITKLFELLNVFISRSLTRTKSLDPAAGFISRSPAVEYRYVFKLWLSGTRHDPVCYVLQNVIASALNIASSSLNSGSITSHPVCDVLLQFFMKQVEAAQE